MIESEDKDYALLEQVGSPTEEGMSFSCFAVSTIGGIRLRTGIYGKEQEVAETASRASVADSRTLSAIGNSSIDPGNSASCLTARPPCRSRRIELRRRPAWAD